MRYKSFTVALTLAALSAPFADAQLGTAFTYQGRLDVGGSPADGSYDLRFTLYREETDGSVVAGPTCNENVDVQDGLFTALVDFGPDVFGSSARWLGIEVRADSTPGNCATGAYSALTPRQELKPAPNALFAMTAETAFNASLFNGQTASFFQNAANLDIGTLADDRLSANVCLLDREQSFTDEKHFAARPTFDNATIPFIVESNTRVPNLNADLLDGLDSTAFLRSIPIPLTLSGTSDTHIIRAENASATNFASGVFGRASAGTGLTYGGFFDSASIDGRAVLGFASAATGTTYGVYGVSVSTDGRGVFGAAAATSGAAYGGYFASNSTSGIGVFGEAAAAGNGFTYGGRFESVSTNGRGVYGLASAATGMTFGGRFASTSPDGRGVYGAASAATGINYGVYGESASESGFGVYGLSTDSVGVRGHADGTTGGNYGVQGISDSTGGYGVYGESAGIAGVRGVVTGTTGTKYGVYGNSLSSGGYGVYGTNADNVGVRGVATGTTGVNYGVQGHSDSSGGYGVYGTSDATSGLTRGGYFQVSSTGGRAVEGANLATSGANYGGYFSTNSAAGTGVFASAGGGAGAGYGVHGQSGGDTGRGVFGSAFGSGIVTGVWGESSSTTGRGVFGDATASSGSTYGVRGESASTSGRGVFGWATAGTGSTQGVYGRSDSPDGVGVRGYVNSTANGSGDFPFGVFGEVLGDYGSGVHGLGDFYGTTGRFNNAVTGFGVFSFGTLGASGAKTFRIDHPDDPENKYLLHYSSESPECLNFYSGTATLDAEGFASIELPAYFAKINRDPRYQLTPIGAPMPMLHVASEINAAAIEAGDATSFIVGGGVPGGRVSWRVEAVRDDLYTRRYGAPVEIDKRPGERGTYQHPELYGRPIEMRPDYAPPSATLSEGQPESE